MRGSSNTDPRTLEERVLILAPSHRDAPTIAGVLTDAGLASEICTDLVTLRNAFEQGGAGAALIAEEALGREQHVLRACLDRQPPWSDLPVVLVATASSGRSGSLRRDWAGGRFADLGNATLLERPLRSATLVSALRSALRARRRQYQVREHLREREQNEARLRHHEAELRRLNDTLEQRVEERTRKLAESESRFRLLVQSVTDYAIFMLDAEGRVSNWNSGAARIKGYTAAEIAGQHFSRFYTEEDRLAGIPAKALAIAAREGRYEAEGWRVRKDGSHFWASVVIDVIRDETGKLLGFAKVTRDITERKRAAEVLETTREQLARAQKMEAIGQLTGGVAHDFNNLLSAVLGNLELLETRLGDDEKARRLAGSAIRAAERGAKLTQQLLAFARKQHLRPEPVDINAIVTGMGDLLSRTIGGTVRLNVVLQSGIWPAIADVSQIELMILNLAINARDAMPLGGSLIIETANVTPAERPADLASGDFIRIAVTDSGTGMSPEVLAKAFEPFFTTKEIGKGTGLGLAQVYGAVKQLGGDVRIRSRLGEGTTVSIYLPRTQRVPVGADADAAEPAPQRTRARILLIDDDPDVREVVAAGLEGLGYHVRVVSNARAGLEFIDHGGESVDVLVVDFAMPQMNGMEFARAAGARRPALPIVFITGYVEQALNGEIDRFGVVVKKPFKMAQLAGAVEAALRSRTANIIPLPNSKQRS
jgi:PAS domain S-box-containing protein